MLDLKDGRCFVIAEAGTAHAGAEEHRLFRALDLVDAAANGRADAVKFQWFHNPNPDTMFCWIDGDEARAPRWHASFMPPDDWKKVRDYALGCGIVLLASVFEKTTVQWLVDLELQATKVASRAAKNFPYEGLPKPFLISTGMDGPGFDPPGSVYLQCEASYPSSTAWRGVVDVGFSDHSGKPFLGIDAIARGCKLLEVHYMIDRIDAGPDLPACLTVDELKLVCEARDYYANRA